jgi:hypothetical protein
MRGSGAWVDEAARRVMTAECLRVRPRAGRALAVAVAGLIEAHAVPQLQHCRDECVVLYLTYASRSLLTAHWSHCSLRTARPGHAPFTRHSLPHSLTR